MTQHICVAAHRHCDPSMQDCRQVVGALRCPDQETMDGLVARLQEIKHAGGIKGGISWSRVGQNKMASYRKVIDAFVDTDASFSFVFAPAKQLPLQGACFALYRMYLEALERWMEPGDMMRLVVEADFDQHPCGGRDCKVAYVGGTNCKAAQGKKLEQKDSLLSTADLYSIMERNLSPQTGLELCSATEEWQNEALQLVDILLGACTYALAGNTGSVAKLELAERLAGGLGLSSLKEVADGILQTPRWHVKQLSNLEHMPKRGYVTADEDESLIPEYENLVF